VEGREGGVPEMHRKLPKPRRCCHLGTACERERKKKPFKKKKKNTDEETTVTG
jgi:hypothetical protein